jgi:hypothetical protein
MVRMLRQQASSAATQILVHRLRLRVHNQDHRPLGRLLVSLLNQRLPRPRQATSLEVKVHRNRYLKAGLSLAIWALPPQQPPAAKITPLQPSPCSAPAQPVKRLILRRPLPVSRLPLLSSVEHRPRDKVRPQLQQRPASQISSVAVAWPRLQVVVSSLQQHPNHPHRLQQQLPLHRLRTYSVIWVANQPNLSLPRPPHPRATSSVL